jgi:uncharacterized protein (TIGR03437 family)
MLWVTRTLAVFGLAMAAQAQPGIRQNGVVNSASRIPPTLAGGAIARGALFTIYGVRLGSPGHSQVTVLSGGKVVEARILSSTAEQIDAEMPPRAPLGAATLIVKADGQESAPFPLEIASENPGLFSRNGQGWGPGRIENSNRSDNSTSNPAQPRGRVTLFGTGFGNSTGITVIVGGRAIKLARSGAIRSEEKIEFSIPANAPEGCYVPVYVLASPVRASNVVTMSIHSGTGPCRPGPVPLLDAGAIGVAIVSRTRMKPKGESADTTADEAAVTFASKDNRPVLSPILLLPPAGTCTAYTSSFQADAVLPNSISAALVSLLAGHGLDAGSQLTITSAGQSRNVVRVNGVPGYYRGGLGQAGPAARKRAPPLFLGPGDLILAGSGGRDVGAFNVRFSGPVPFEWTDRDSLGAIDRARPQAVHWKNESRDRLIVILATNVDQITTAIGTCLCVADASAGEFAIPPAMLANVPASQDIGGIPYDQLYLSSIPAGPPPPIQAKGLQSGAVFSLYTVGKLVQYR